MKILKLDLTAFGPFTDTSLDFSRNGRRFHIIYGPNEAGKSSALRALHQLLYGIPGRSPDAFLHPYQKMRIGGTLRLDNGPSLEFVRRKGIVNTLRKAGDGELLEETQLASFLSGIDESLFSTMFGIDHERLVEGGKEIVRGGGEIGRILFSAGAGISDFRKVQEQLRAEADQLFLPSGKKPKINLALSDLRKIRAEIREAQLSGANWESHHDALRDAERNLEKVDGDLSEKKAELNRLKRIGDALQDMSLRKELLEKRKSLGHSPLLPEDFGKRRTQLLTSLEIAKNLEKNARKNIEDIEKGLKDLNPSTELLELSETIENLYQDLGAFRKNKEDRQVCLVRRESLLAESKKLLSVFRKGLTPEQAEAALPDRKTKEKVKALVTKNERLAERRENALDDRRRLRLKLDKLEREIEKALPCKKTDKLQNSVKRARKAGDPEGNLDKKTREIRRREKEIENDLAILSLGPVPPEEILVLPVPAPGTVDEYERLMTESSAAIVKFRDEEDESNRLISDAENEILRLNGSNVPSESDLKEARATRDRGWQLVRLAWKENACPEKEAREFVQTFEPADGLDTAFESSIRKSDDLADRLRLEADRVARMESLKADVKTRKDRLDFVLERIESESERFSMLESKWNLIWSKIGVPAESPVQMRAWISKFETLSQKSKELLVMKEEVLLIEDSIRYFRAELSANLAALGEKPASEKENLEQLLERCEILHEEMADRKNKRESVENDLKQRAFELEESETRLKACESEMAEWKKSWAKTVEPLGLPIESDVAEALAVLEDAQTLAGKLEEIKGIDQRIGAIDKQEESFVLRLRHAAEKCAADLKEAPAEESAPALNHRLRTAREQSTRRLSLLEEKSKEFQHLRKADEEKQAVLAGLKSMCDEAKVRSVDELGQALERSSILRQTLQDLKSAEDRLRKLSAGDALEDFLSQIEAADPDRIDHQIEIVSEKIVELEIKKSELHETIGTEKNELSKMEGGAKAAELSENYQSVIAGLRRDAEHYIRLKTGLTILSRAVENYREKHQGPILSRSGELFAVMTLGSFEGLRVEPGEKGESVLMGVRAKSGELVTVDAMSDGTTDQLFLAIRLASLESYARSSEPMPFIVDDILVNFDDDRAVATLGILAEFSETAQVIFLTHHRHLLELAKKSRFSDKFDIHHL